MASTGAIAGQERRAATDPRSVAQQRNRIASERQNALMRRGQDIMHLGPQQYLTAFVSQPQGGLKVRAQLHQPCPARMFAQLGVRLGHADIHFVHILI